MQTHTQQPTKKHKPRTRILQQPETTYTSNTSNSNVNGGHHEKGNIGICHAQASFQKIV